MTSMRVRLTRAVSLSALCIGGEGGWGDVDEVDVVLQMLVAYAEDNNGDDDTYGDNNDTVTPCCPCYYL